MRLFLVAAVLLAIGCKEEPTIVITFAPQDLAGVKPPDMAKPADLARPPDLAPLVAAPAEPCKRDADCAVAKADCCGCPGGGKAVAVAKAKAKGYEKELAGRCADTMCPSVMSTDASCASVAACVDGKCALREKAAGKKK